VPYLNITGLMTAYSVLKRSANYALLAPLDNQLLELARHVFANNKGSVFLLSEQVDMFFNGEQGDVFHQLFEQGRLYPFRLHYDSILAKKSHFSRGVINELKHYDELKDSTVVVHLHSERISSLDEVQLTKKISYYRELAISQSATVIFLISGAEVNSVRRQFLGINTLFDGMIFMTQEASIRTLEYDYWSHSEGVIAAKSVNLQLLNKQLSVFESDLDAHTDKRSMHQELDEDEVWVVRSAVPQGTKLPALYKVVEDNDALYKTALTRKAATLVFSVTRYTDLSALAQECFLLRKQCGRKLKLVIQNVDGIIRHQDECLFLALGVNLILYSFSEPSRLLSQIQSIQGFQFSRPLPDSIDDVLKYSESALSKGYLPILRFAEQVSKHSDSAANLGVSGVLVMLQLLPRIEAIHPLHLFHVKREGDLFSYADGYIYLYLHACREHDVESAIKHLFKLQVSDFFTSKNIIADHFYIQQECRRIQRDYNQQEVPDYTEQLKENVSYIFDAKVADIANLNTETPEFKKIIRPISTPVSVEFKSDER
jgi:cellulose biosynthesis protein BcsE